MELVWTFFSFVAGVIVGIGTAFVTLCAFIAIRVSTKSRRLLKTGIAWAVLVIAGSVLYNPGSFALLPTVVFVIADAGVSASVVYLALRYLRSRSEGRVR